MLNFKPCKMG